MIVETGRGRAGMIQPLLDPRDIGAVVERDGGGRGAQRVGAKADHLLGEAGGFGMAADQPVDRIGMQGFFQIAGAAVSERAKEGAFQITAMAGSGQIGVNPAERFGMGGKVADLAAFSLNAQMGDASY